MVRRFDFINSNTRNACPQGSTFQAGVYLTDSYGVPTDLTGYTAKMQVRSTAASGTVLLEISTSNTYITITAAKGKIAWSVPATITAAVAAGMYVYDLEITSAGSIVKRILEGKFEVSAEVTRA